MRSKWSAESALTWLAVVTMEAAWITLIYVGIQWLGIHFTLELGIGHFALGVAIGMVLAQTFATLAQSRYAAILTVAAICAAAIAAVLADPSWTDPGALIRFALLNPGSWLLGLAVLRGAAHSDLADTLATERVFNFGVPGLVAFWLTAWLSGLSDNPTFGTAAFAATLSFVAAGLLALGLGRLADLEVEAIDRGARRRWVVMLLAIVGALLLIGVPLSAALGLPVSAALAGILGPLVPLVLIIGYILAVPVFALFNLIIGLLGPASTAPQPSVFTPPVPSGGGLLPQPPTGPPPDFTWLVIVFVIVGALVLLRFIAETLQRPERRQRGRDIDEIRSSEPFSLPELPAMPHLRLPRARRAAPSNASQAYLASLAALAASDAGRAASETPREHATRIFGAPFGREMALLAADYQLGSFGERPLTPVEDRRAVHRWRRVTALARQLRSSRGS